MATTMLNFSRKGKGNPAKTVRNVCFLDVSVPTKILLGCLENGQEMSIRLICKILEFTNSEKENILDSTQMKYRSDIIKAKFGLRLVNVIEAKLPEFLVLLLIEQLLSFDLVDTDDGKVTLEGKVRIAEGGKVASHVHARHGLLALTSSQLDNYEEYVTNNKAQGVTSYNKYHIDNLDDYCRELSHRQNKILVAVIKTMQTRTCPIFSIFSISLPHKYFHSLICMQVLEQPMVPLHNYLRRGMVIQR